jgi:GrpB-like predicted nucleotidyltransferase (UPF0157 family)
VTTRPIGEERPIPAVLRPYDPRSPEVARKVSGMIRELVPEVTVEHVGSTAVPGCAGKGVVDLLIPYHDDELDRIKRALEDLGFQRQSTRNPFPEDRPMRVGTLEHEGDAFRLHVHVVPADSGEVRELRLFRDRLRSDPELLRSYVDRKKRIIEGGTTDPMDYALVKGDFVREALDETSG